MYKKVLLLVFTTLSLNANEMLIKQDLSIHTKISPTTYSSVIQIIGSEKLHKEKNLSLENKNKIIQTYNSINTFLKNNSICKGGSFDISPFYEYQNNTREQKGFESSYSLNCEFKDEKSQDFNKILDFIQKQVASNDYLLLPIPRITKIIQKGDLEKIDRKLNQALLDKANTIAQDYSKNLDKRCTIKEISLGLISEMENMPLHSTAILAKSDSNSLEDIVMPTGKEVEKMARGKVIFSCK